MSLRETFVGMEDDQFLVRIDGLALAASIGVYPHEKALRQTIVVDLAWLVSAAAVVDSDDLPDTIDYDQVASCIEALLVGEHFNLLETLTQRMLDTLCSRFAFDRLQISVSKPAAISAAKSVSVTRTSAAKSSDTGDRMLTTTARQ